MWKWLGKLTSALWKGAGKAVKWVMEHPEIAAPVIEAIAKAKEKKPPDVREDVSGIVGGEPED